MEFPSVIVDFVEVNSTPKVLTTLRFNQTQLRALLECSEYQINEKYYKKQGKRFDVDSLTLKIGVVPIR